MDEKIKELEGKYKKYAEENGFKLNPDKKILEGLLRGLLSNEKKYGKKYCPCRRVQGIPEKDKEIICPCVYHKKEIKEQGHCHCFLFVSKEVS
ncbi:MAG: ferredoxin:thioredoxin reductase [Candidatus Aenigmarchaeota archaeon]|nr:ferredoxin:thioredoxin reductase [Candidatus Aenigmarchaeota archaeon]